MLFTFKYSLHKFYFRNNKKHRQRSPSPEKHEV